MPTVEETPAVSETPKTGKSAFAAARTSLSAPPAEDKPPADEPRTDSSPAPETPAPETPAEEPDTPADQPPEPGLEPEDALLSAEEVAKLTPEQLKQYKQMNRAFTQKTQKLAAERKDMEQWKPLIDAFSTNPEAAVTHLAGKLGLKVAKADAATVTEKTAETLAELPEEWRFLAPVFDAYGKKLLESVRGEIAPIRQAQDHILSEAVAAETEATLKAMDVEHQDWRKHEAKMLAIGKKFIPTPGSMTDLEYMRILYKLATADITEAEKTKKVVEKINKAKDAVEPSSPGAPDASVEIVMPAGLEDSGKRFKAAQAAAKRGERWTK